MRIASPALPCYPVLGFGSNLDTALAVKSLESLTEFRKIFNGLIGFSSAMVLNFLKHSFYIPHLKLNLFLEFHLLEYSIMGSGVEALYPGGAKLFRRDCSIYLGVTLAQWVTRRKIQLASAWIRYGGHTLEEVGGVLGWRDLRCLRKRIIEYGGELPDDSAAPEGDPDPAAVHQGARPFWIPEEPERDSRSREYDDPDMYPPGFAQEESALLAQSIQPKEEMIVANDPVSSDAPVKPSVENFLAMKTTLTSSHISLESMADWEAGAGALDWEWQYEALAA